MNPIEGFNSRPEQAFQETPWGVKACCGRCQGIVANLLCYFSWLPDPPTLITTPSSLPLDQSNKPHSSWLPVINKLHLVSSPIRRYDDQGPDTTGNGAQFIWDVSGEPHLAYRRCHWSSSPSSPGRSPSPFSQHLVVLDPAPPALLTALNLGWYLFYGRADQVDVAAENDDLGLGSLSSTSLVLYQINAVTGAFHSPLLDHDSYFIGLPHDPNVEGGFAAFQLKGWSLCLLSREVIQQEVGSTHIYTIWMNYSLQRTPYRCREENIWQPTYDNLHWPSHTITTKPFQP